MKLKHYILYSVTVFALKTSAMASTLYGTTSAGGPGELWILDPATGAGLQDIGPLNDTNGANYPITGLAFHPVTGVLYGSSGNFNSATKDKLVTINPATGVVTLIGSLNVGSGNTMADLDFDSSGTLYGIGSSGGASLYTVNITTGQATIVAASGFSVTAGGGLAISSSHVFYATPEGNDLGTFDPVTGQFSFIGTLATPAGANTSYASLAYGGNTLYGINLGSPPHLVTIDTTTATATDLGASVASIDAIAFAPPLLPPSLNIFSTTNGVVLSWPSSAGNFRLQQNSNIATTNWTANTNLTNLVGGSNQVTVTPSGTNLFFRLISP